MFNLDDCIACITSKAAKKLGQRIEKRIEKHHVTRVQWMALYYINLSKHTTQKELADRMVLTEATVVRLIDRMEKENLVIRTNHENDKRKKYVELTEKGAQLNKEVTVIVEAFKDKAISNISEEDLDTYKRVLDQMLKNTFE